MEPNSVRRSGAIVQAAPRGVLPLNSKRPLRGVGEALLQGGTTASIALMQAALMANTGWLDEELLLYNDLVVGLIDEQVRVTQVLPEGEAERQASAFGRVATWSETPWRVVNRLGLSRLASRFEGDDIDVVHALDGRLWPAACVWSAKLGVPAVLSAWSVLDAQAARRMRRRLDPQRTIVAATTQPLQRMLRQELDASQAVELTPVGVHAAPPPPEPTDDPQRALSIVVTGNGRLDGYVEPLFEGLRMLINELPDTQVFVDTMGFDQRELWNFAERCRLLSNLSFVPRRIGQRRILLRADLFVQPQPLGRARGLLLQAMAHARPVLAQDDAALDFLLDGETARVVRSPSAGEWCETLSHWAGSTSERRELGDSARRWVAEHRLASGFVSSVLQVYRKLTSEPLPFAGG